ncbi:MAG: hypothetical protein HY751_02325 [Nitrospinae bacterium]|nr:hypothetical protein [Nitrospinota bacterium]
MVETGGRLIFVYNAGSSLFDKITDFTHKIISPATYSCNLCMITFDSLGMKKEWADFIKTLSPPPVFLHKDEFAEKYPALAQGPFPAVFLEKEGQLGLWITPAEIASAGEVDGLKKLVLEKTGMPGK